MDAQDVPLGLKGAAQEGGPIRQRTGNNDCLNRGIGEDFFQIALGDVRSADTGLGTRNPRKGNGGSERDEFVPPGIDESAGEGEAIGVVAEQSEAHANPQ